MKISVETSFLHYFESLSNAQLFLEATITTDYNWLKAVLVEVPGLLVTISLIYNLLRRLLQNNLHPKGDRSALILFNYWQDNVV
jgi:hypothetical protein